MRLPIILDEVKDLHANEEARQALLLQDVGTSFMTESLEEWTDYLSSPKEGEHDRHHVERVDSIAKGIAT